MTFSDVWKPNLGRCNGVVHVEHRVDRASGLDPLAWRAAAADFLSDIWDLTGSPMFDVAECGIASATLLTSASRFGGEARSHCLQPTGS